MPLVGFLALSAALFSSLYALLSCIALVRRAPAASTRAVRLAVQATAVFTTLASATLLYLLISRDFQVVYVHEHSSTHLPLLYTISAFWAGQEGSLLLWFWLLTVLAVLVMRAQDLPAALWPHTLGVMAATNAFFALMLIVTSNPFVTYVSRPAEGIGMLPALQNPGMAIHPPLLFFGYAGYTVPFAFAFGALASGELNPAWLRAVRRWNLLAWSTLGAGILIGAWWSYVELGWGGYWAWDPVENASLIPWLLGTAFVHSAMAEERRGTQRSSNIILATLCFVACLFATLVTRGGIVISELHGFAQATQPIAYLLVAAIGAALVSMVVLMRRRMPELRDLREVQSLISRDASLVLLNLLFVGAAASVLLGTIFPSLVQAIRGNSISLSTSFYNRAVGPLLMAILILMGICPAIGWHRMSHNEQSHLIRLVAVALASLVLALLLGVRQVFVLVSVAACTFVAASIVSLVWHDLRRWHSQSGASAVTILQMLRQSRARHGAQLVHLAIVLIAIGITGSTAYKQEALVNLRRGEHIEVARYTIYYEDLTMQELHAEPLTYQSRLRIAATLGIESSGSRRRTLTVEKSLHYALDMPVTEVAIYSTLRDDLYVVLNNLSQDGVISLLVAINPLVNWIWIGGALLLLGTLIAAWPSRPSSAARSETCPS